MSGLRDSFPTVPRPTVCPAVGWCRPLRTARPRTHRDWPADLCEQRPQRNWYTPLTVLGRSSLCGGPAVIATAANSPTNAVTAAAIRRPAPPRPDHRTRRLRPACPPSSLVTKRGLLVRAGLADVAQVLSGHMPGHSSRPEPAALTATGLAEPGANVSPGQAAWWANQDG